MTPPSPAFAQARDSRAVVCSGTLVDVCMPDASDYSFLISLRNRDDVRRWFLDDRRLQPEQAVGWLISRANRRDDVLLLIRHRKAGMNLGSIGWTQLDEVNLSAEFGRLAIDPCSLRKLANAGEPREALAALAVDACRAVRDHAFAKLGLNTMRTCYKRGNATAAKVNAACGLIPVTTVEREPSDELVHLELTRARWELVRSGEK